MSADDPAVLELDGVSKNFGGLRALSQVSFSIAQGEIVGLIGPNGAGKTALINCITGFYRCDLGHVRMLGRDIGRDSLHAIGRAGIARTFQNLRLFRRMSVLENVMVAQPSHVRHPMLAALRVRRQADKERARELLARFGLADRANQSAGALSYGDGRRLEIARALATHPQLLLLDEPAAGMNEEETVALANDIRSLMSDVRAIMLVEHDMSFVRSLAKRVVALDSGEKIAEGAASAVLNHPRVIEAYLGGMDEANDDAAA